MPRKDKPESIAKEVRMEKKYFAVVFGMVLQQLREEHGWSMLAVAEAAKVVESSICRYEYGAKTDTPLHEMTQKDVDQLASKVRVPDLFTAYKLANVFGLTLDQLMNRCVDMVEQAKKFRSQEKRR